MTLLDTLLHSLAGAVDPASDERPEVEGIERITFADLKIRTKERGLLMLEPNPVQVDYLNLLCPGWQEPNRAGDLNALRENILKARQFGLTTLILALLFLDTLSRQNTYSVVVAHDAESTERLFQIVKTFYDNLPEHKKPRTKYANRREYVWPELNSSFFVGQAGSRDFGRSSTINNLLATEVAFWPDPERLFPAILGAVPTSGNAFIESTANGFGSWHQKEYVRSKNGESSFAARFYAWFRHWEYRAPVAPDFDRVTQTLDKDEREAEELLQSKYGVTREQLQWRRNKMREPGMALKFAQEFPANDEEAFLNSGRSAFRSSWVLAQTQWELPPLDNATLPPSVRAAFGLELDNLRVYEKPRANREYVAFADVSEGLAQGDFSGIVVLDRETQDEVACYHGKPEPDILGVYVDALARFYNNARNGVERNNHGHTTLAKMKALNTPNQFVFDDDRRGWVTNERNKPQIIDALGITLRDALTKVRSAKARNEMRAYSQLANGRFGAPFGEHDDLVMAYAGALEMIKRWRVWTPKERPKSVNRRS